MSERLSRSAGPPGQAPLDQPARDRARFELSRNVVVEAGAGTGKTTLLTDRILFTLLAGGAGGKGLDLTRVVALTFTEKAAGEVQLRLAGRLADLIAEAAGGLPEGERRSEARRLLAEAGERFGLAPERVAAVAGEALERMDRAMIGTIHHFASHLLRLHPLEAGVDPGFEVDTGAGFDELFEAEWAFWLDHELGERAPRREAWLEVLPLAGLEDLGELARSLSLEETRQCAPGASEAMRARLAALSGFLRGLKGKPKPKGTSKILERAEEAAAMLEELAEACSGRGKLPERLASRPARSSKWPASWADDPEEETYAEAMALVAKTCGDEERLLRRATALVEPFAERFAERYRRRGLISYFGLLRRARDLVRDRAEVREALKARYGAIFIDEFQDTDPVQGELLLYLAERAGRSAESWPALELEPGKLFVVGDPKQSIYRFRGADMRAYQEFTALLLDQGALKCDLQTSFRAHAGVVEPVNRTHERLMGREEGLQPAYLAIQPYRTQGPEAAVELVVARGADGAEEGRGWEAAWIASWVSERCGPGRPFAYRDVAILLRTTTSLGAYLDALKDAGLPYAVEADRYFYGTQEVLDLLNLLRALDDPEDRLSLAGLLRSPLAALDDRELYELQLARRLDYRKDLPPGLSRDAGKRLEGLWRALRSLRGRAGREPLGDFVARVFRETFLVELASAAYFGEQTASNLLKFARLAAQAGDARGATLKEFIGLVERSVRDSAEEGESPLADEHLDAVRLLTVHKAKGLEWPVVIVPNMAGKPGGGEGPAWRVDWGAGALGLALRKAGAADAAMAFLELDEARRQRYEAVRLLYVAMTRAKDRLILIGAQKPSGEQSFAGLLAKAGAWPAEASPSAVELGGCRLPIAYLDERPAGLGGQRAASSGAALGDLAGLARALKRRSAEGRAAEAPAVTSASRLAAAEKAYRPEPAAPEDAPLRPADPRLVGVVCHKTLEHWDFAAGGDVAEAVKSACVRLEREGSAESLLAVSEECEEVLESFVSSPAAAELAKAEILGRELPFLYAEGGQVVRGSIDVLYRSGGELWIADYKTERVSARQAAELAKRHGVQARIYQEAVKRTVGERCGFKLLFLRTGKSVAA